MRTTQICARCGGARREVMHRDGARTIFIKDGIVGGLFEFLLQFFEGGSSHLPVLASDALCQGSLVQVLIVRHYICDYKSYLMKLLPLLVMQEKKKKGKEKKSSTADAPAAWHGLPWCHRQQGRPHQAHSPCECGTGDSEDCRSPGGHEACSRGPRCRDGHTSWRSKPCTMTSSLEGRRGDKSRTRNPHTFFASPSPLLWILLFLRVTKCSTLVPDTPSQSERCPPRSRAGHEQARPRPNASARYRGSRREGAYRYRPTLVPQALISATKSRAAADSCG